MLRSRSNSAYSLQDLSHRPPSHRPSQPSDGNSSDTRPRNSNTSARGDVSAAPQREEEEEEEEQKRSRLGRFWREYVSCEVDFSASRDHLANERTFLGYLRTSVAMSMVGTVVAQLFSLQHEGQHQAFGYFATGKPLAMTCYSFSIGTILLGAVRTWRHQRTMMSGKALVGGFELHLLGICSMLLLMVFFSFLLAIDVVKDKEPVPTATP